MGWGPTGGGGVGASLARTDELEKLKESYHTLHLQGERMGSGPVRQGSEHVSKNRATGAHRFLESVNFLLWLQARGACGLVREDAIPGPHHRLRRLHPRHPQPRRPWQRPHARPRHPRQRPIGY